MGAFDDLIPAAQAPAQRTGAFDDLVPPAQPPAMEPVNASPVPSPHEILAGAYRQQAQIAPEPAAIAAPEIAPVVPNAQTPELFSNWWEVPDNKPLPRGVVTDVMQPAEELANALGRGWNTLQQQGDAILQRVMPGYGDEQFAADVAQHEMDKAQYPMSEDVKIGQEQIMAQPTIIDAIKALAANPKASAPLLAESAPASIPSIVGALGGAAAGTAVQPGAGTIGGMMLGTGLGSGGVEYGAALLDMMQEQGVDISDKAQVMAKLQDKDFMQEANKRGLISGAIIGGVDALTAGAAGAVERPIIKAVGGKAVRQAAKDMAEIGQHLGIDKAAIKSAADEAAKQAASRTARVAGLTGEVALQGAGGMAGEAGKQKAVKGEIDSPAAIALEGVMESVAGAPEIALGIRARKGQKFNTGPAADPSASQGARPAAGRAPASEAAASAPVTPSGAAEPVTVQPVEPPAAVKPVIPQEPPAQPTQAPAAPIAAPAVQGTEAPARPNPPAPAAAPRRVITPDNKQEIDVEPEVVELDDLISSDNPKYDKRFQPRDRSRQSSDVQTTEIANALDPARLDESRTTDQGAPIIGMDDNMVESGNGRIMAIRKAYEAAGESAQKYRDYLASKGYDVSKMKQPVLVRRRKTKLDDDARQKFTLSSNERAAASLSMTERAMADSTVLTDDDMALYRGGDVTSLANSEFRKRYLSKIASNDRGAMTNPDGTLSQEGQRRMNAGMLARGYGDSAIVSNLTEDTDTNIKGIGNALQSVAGEMARLRSAVSAGTVPKSMDIAKQIVRAAKAVRDARANGKSITEVVDQPAMFAEENLDDVTKEIIRAFYQPDMKRAASAEKIEAFLRKYVTEAEKATVGDDMLGNKELTPLDIIKTIKGKEQPAAEQPKMDFRGKKNESKIPQKRRVYYHGSRNGKIKELKPSMHDETVLKGIAFTPNKKIAEYYSKARERNKDGSEPNPHIIEAYIDTNNIPKIMGFYEDVEAHYGREIPDISEEEIQRYAKENNIQAIDTSDIGEEGEIFVLDPSVIKIINDPPNSGEASALPERIKGVRLIDREDGDLSFAPRSTRTPGGNEPPTTMGGRTLESMSMVNRPSFRTQLYSAMGLDPEKAVNMAPRVLIEKAKPMFKEMFGLEIQVDKGADYGKSLDNLTDVWITFQFLSKVLGLPNKAIGLRGLKVMPDGTTALGGGLTLRLSKSAGDALGVFYPMENTIRIPDRSNSFAHEWGHALDYFVLRAMGTVTDGMGKMFRGFTSRVRRDGLENYEPGSVAEAWVNLMNTLFFDDAFGAAKLMELQDKLARARTDKSKAEIQEQIDKIKAGNYAGHDYRSPYYQGAKRIPAGGDKGYWTRPTEMLARAMEAYVAMKVEAIGGSTEILAKGNDGYLNTADERVAAMYPQLEDRVRIFLAIDQMIGAMRTASMFEQGDVANMNDLPMAEDEKHWLKLTSIPDERSLIQKFKDKFSKEERQRRKDAAALAKAMKEARPKNPLSVKNTLGDIRRMATASSISAIQAILERNPKGSALHSVVRSLGKHPGSGEYQQKTFFADVDMLADKYKNKVSDIIGVYDLDQNNEQEMLLLSEMSQGLPETVKIGGNRHAQLKAAAAALRKVYDAIRYDANKMLGQADADLIAYYGDAGYQYQMFDKAAITADVKGAQEDFSAAYAIKFDKEFGDDPDPVLFSKVAQQVMGDDPRVKQLIKLIKQQQEQAEAGEDVNEDEGSDEVAELVEELYDEVREAYSDERARALMTKLLVGDEFAPETVNSAGFKKQRTLPPETLPILQKWRVTNPVDALMNYIGKTSRHAAYEFHFGDMHAKMERAIMDQNFKVEDAHTIVAMVDKLTGKDKPTIPPSQQRIINFTRVLMTTMIMARAPFASLPENFVMSMRTGRVRDGWKSLYYTLKKVIGTKDVKELQRALEAAGVLRSVLADQVMSQKLDGSYQNDPKSQNFLFRFYENNYLGMLTRTQRVGAAAAGLWYMNDQAKIIVNEKNSKEKRDAARRALSEFGIPPAQVDEFAKYLVQLPDIFPTELQVGAGKDTDPFAKLHMRALHDLLQQTIQDPNAATGPAWAQSSMGSWVYALMRFNFAYWENAMKSNKNFMVAEYGRQRATGDGKTVAGTQAAAKTAMRFFPAYAQYFLATSLIYLIRTMIFFPQKIEELEKEGGFDAVMKYIFTGGIMYTLPGGPAVDVMVNMANGIKYEKDLTSITAGAPLGAALQDAQSLARSFTKNSPNTNAAERARVKALYDLTVAPVSTFLTGTIGGPLGKVMGLANMFITSGAAKEKAADLLAGPKKKSKDKGD